MDPAPGGKKNKSNTLSAIKKPSRGHAMTPTWTEYDPELLAVKG
jgi:hypothetical protein